MSFNLVFCSSFAVVALAAPASAQPRAATVDEMRQELARGDRISLVQTDGEVHAGQLLRLGTSDLTVRTILKPSTGQPRRQLDMTIPLDSVQSLERLCDSSRNGTLIGASVGAGFVVTMFARAVAIDRNEIDEWGHIYLAYGALFTGVGALVGRAIDNAHPRPIRFDRAADENAKISLVPIWLARGVAVTVSF